MGYIEKQTKKKEPIDWDSVRNLYKQHALVRSQTKVTMVFEEIRPEMRSLIYFMVGMSMLAIGLILSQAAFAIDFLTMP